MPEEQVPDLEGAVCYDIEEIDENIDIGDAWVVLCVEYRIDPCWQEVSIAKWGGVRRWDPWRGEMICFPCDGFEGADETYTFDEFRKKKEEIIEWVGDGWYWELNVEDRELEEADGLTRGEIEALKKIRERLDELEDKLYEKAEEAVNKIEKVIEYYKTHKPKEEDCY